MRVNIAFAASFRRKRQFVAAPIAQQMSNPHVPDSAHWDAAFEHYHWDRLAEAYDEVQKWGIGEAGGYLRWYRVIEAEAVTREQSVILPINDWLSLEVVQRHAEVYRRELVDRIVGTCDLVADRFGWDHREKTMISILAEETDAPWATHPYGYCVRKEHYEKICLPDYLVENMDEFLQAVAHEYTHVISEAFADGYAPRWMEEALSVLVESRFDTETWEEFRTGEIPWKSAFELELTLEGRSSEDEPGFEMDMAIVMATPMEDFEPLEDDDEEEEEEAVASEQDSGKEVWRAYQQSGWIGRYLASLGDERRIARLLHQIADESPEWNLDRTLKRKDRVEAALETVYGFGVKDLFALSLDFLRAQEAV